MGLRRRYVKAVLLSPYIGSLLLCAAGLAMGGLLLGRMAKGAPAANVAAAKKSAERPAAVAGTIKAGPAAEMAAPARVVRAAMVTEQPQFSSPIGEDERRMLREVVGRPSGELMRDERVLRVVDEVVPYEPIHIGLDEPLTQALEGTLRRSVLPVTLRDGRYLMLSKVRETVPSSTPQTGRGRGFLWVDLKTGLAIGGIYFHPTNGEPTPTLTLFSKQLGSHVGGMRALPAAFRADLNTWGESWKMPALATVTQYFIHSAGKKTVLAHDERCDALLTVADCAKQRAATAEVDQKAMEYLGQTHYASNATAWMLPVSGGGSE